MTKNRSKLYNVAYDSIRSKAQQIVGSQALYRSLSEDSKRELRDASKKLLLLSDLDNPLKKYQDSKTKYSSGYVYLVTNEAWPDWIKVGRAINTKTRLKAYQTSSPLRDYEILIKHKCTNTQKLESILLEDIKEHADEFRGEWLKIDRAIALNLFKHIVSNRG
jgi:adenine specific DNA methylase Mod